ncbi:hypothetical protein QYE76_026774 [Lolium multiflorum]|uniref:Protein kinase domain-containing protein n=1 Tax=Lolium multiflorum TaxID=4521 RepID=A0AAD8VVJ5_LOLMU|nr:hypothetical protein QYE76_026774 [Lolium multiflorum]
MPGTGGEEALRQQYVLGEEIGRGRFGVVRRCYSAATGETLAVKSTPKAPLRDKSDPLDLALAEQEPKVHYMMLSGTVPFYGATAPEIFEAVLRGTLRFPPRAFANVSPEAKDLMRRMLCRDVSRRLSAEQVLRHPWIVSRGGNAVAD